MRQTLIDKIWDAHVVTRDAGGADLLYIDMHLLHEVTSPQAFEGLAMAGRRLRRRELTLATMDHNVPTAALDDPPDDRLAARQMEALHRNSESFGVTMYPLGHSRQGIVHVIGPQLGLTVPGTTVVCGDSHTATHGAFGAIAFGIGTSQVEHVMATQTLWQARPQTMAVNVIGVPPAGSTAKDIVLKIVGELGTGGGIDAILEYRGPAIEALSMEGRMTVCNMSIEAGARAGLIAPDDTTFAYVEGRAFAPRGAAWEQALEAWRALASDPGAKFDREVNIDVSQLRPTVTWGITPAQVTTIDGVVPAPEQLAEPADREAAERALAYMGLMPGVAMRDIPLDAVFIGSCTNGRIEDLRAAAAVAQGRRVKDGLRALVVPGSMEVKAQAEAEGLDRVFLGAGFEWRNAGCSLCVGMNADVLAPGQRCASTSNRNFQGRQGRGVRTHLVSPAVAAASAIAGTISSPADLGE